jgi:hypothetical protein
VYDKFTGWPAEMDGLVLAGLSERAAKKLGGTLNQRDHIGRMATLGYRGGRRLLNWSPRL